MAKRVRSNKASNEPDSSNKPCFFNILPLRQCISPVLPLQTLSALLRYAI